MKTPWHNLLQHGTTVAALLVISAMGLILLAVVGTAVLITKFLAFIR